MLVLCTNISAGDDCLAVCCVLMEVLVVCLVSVGGKDVTETAAGFCRVHRIQHAAAAASHQLHRHTDRSVTHCVHRGMASCVHSQTVTDWSVTHCVHCGMASCVHSLCPLWHG